MIEENCCPSCSRLTRLATEVFALKNAVQLAAMALLAAEPPVAAGADDDGADELADALPADAPPLLLPQAVTPAPTTHARRITDDLLGLIAHIL
jgi:hypothetical protein